MRKIESRIIAALRDQSDFKAGNTKVLHGADNRGDVLGMVFLHGNHIATFNRALNQLDIMDCGYSTVTTKSRLNALLTEFAPAWRIIQRDWEWFFDDRSQDTETRLPWTGAATFRAGNLKHRW